MHAILQYKWYIKLQQELYVKWVTYNTSKLLSQGKIVQCAKKNISGKPETMKKCNDTIIATPTWQDWIKQIFTNEIFGRCTCKKETFCAQMCRIAQSDMWHEKTTGRTTKSFDSRAPQRNALRSKEQNEDMDWGDAQVPNPLCKENVHLKRGREIFKRLAII